MKHRIVLTITLAEVQEGLLTHALASALHAHAADLLSPYTNTGDERTGTAGYDFGRVRVEWEKSDVQQPD